MFFFRLIAAMLAMAGGDIDTAANGAIFVHG
jgi:hypothetical protein